MTENIIEQLTALVEDSTRKANEMHEKNPRCPFLAEFYYGQSAGLVRARELLEQAQPELDAAPADVL